METLDVPVPNEPARLLENLPTHRLCTILAFVPLTAEGIECRLVLVKHVRVVTGVVEPTGSVLLEIPAYRAHTPW
eukprot:scaffold108774_cov54-Phaeocystis_antarctica.AAC.2